MPRIRALTAWADRKAGDEWDASEDDARLLCAPDLPGGQKAEYADAAMRAVESPSQTEAQTKRRYMRRDLRAQN